MKVQPRLGGSSLRRMQPCRRCPWTLIRRSPCETVPPHPPRGVSYVRVMSFNTKTTKPTGNTTRTCVRMCVHSCRAVSRPDMRGSALRVPADWRWSLLSFRMGSSPSSTAPCWRTQRARRKTVGVRAAHEPVCAQQTPARPGPVLLGGGRALRCGGPGPGPSEAGQQVGAPVHCPVSLHTPRARSVWGPSTPVSARHSRVRGSHAQWLPWVMQKGPGRHGSVLQWEEWGHTGWQPQQGGGLGGEVGGGRAGVEGFCGIFFPGRHWGMGSLLSLDWADVGPRVPSALSPPALALGGPQQDSASLPFPRLGCLRAGLCLNHLRLGGLQGVRGPVHTHAHVPGQPFLPLPWEPSHAAPKGRTNV